LSYRPISDFWWLARCKYKGGVKRYGGYLGGFPERARRLIGASIHDPVLHICGGMANLYPYAGGYGYFDERQDLDATCNPEYLLDVNLGIPDTPKGGQKWGGMIADPPYSEEDAEKYSPGSVRYPNPHRLVQSAIDSLQSGLKVGIIHYIIPRCPKNAKFIACVGIGCGFANRIRAFSVYEKV
jgi:hypothetical protein